MVEKAISTCTARETPTCDLKNEIEKDKLKTELNCLVLGKEMPLFTKGKRRRRRRRKQGGSRLISASGKNKSAAVSTELCACVLIGAARFKKKKEEEKEEEEQVSSSKRIFSLYLMQDECVKKREKRTKHS
jgi:hypothetical protein